MRIEGRFFVDGEFLEGYVDSSSLRFIESSQSRDNVFIFPFPVNSHTHIGDSFVNEEPFGTLEEIVGPGGFKFKQFASVKQETITEYMINSARFMLNRYTDTFIDFREAGPNLIEQIESVKKIAPDGIILGRPADSEEFQTMKNYIEGVNFSAVSDIDMEKSIEISSEAKKVGKIVATHFSEKKKEPVEKLSELNPDLVVHCTALQKNELNDLKEVCRNIAITPRSNFFHGIYADYSIFFNESINLMLGTDNVMTAEPDIFTEMEFLYRISRNRNRISPEDILKIAFSNPYKFLYGRREKWKRLLIVEDARFSPYRMVTSFHAMKKISSAVL
ncbi:amidohydrolase family protein [Caldiplasma sukawensis]